MRNQDLYSMLSALPGDAEVYMAQDGRLLVAHAKSGLRFELTLPAMQPLPFPTSPVTVAERPPVRTEQKSVDPYDPLVHVCGVMCCCIDNDPPRMMPASKAEVADIAQHVGASKTHPTLYPPIGRRVTDVSEMSVGQLWNESGRLVQIDRLGSMCVYYSGTKPGDTGGHSPYDFFMEKFLLVRS